ncbi:MAG: DUF2442 domain-containing protein [Chloroflexi bacterium]|nr:DUF2442 domain-containing protein [Chloroflexota bacterium]MCI0579939.1 DUF2442 domain-containing protein [Chloroflexota bacterium]MCI0646522.1 DUF2442 domain-containing protein [Chloroflexota bacterium]MCI0726126.1 DUF2442 domain-containing protein [Chloroflexota bacterium]
MDKHKPYGSRLYRVTEFESVGDYVLRIEFDDGSRQLIDFEPILNGPMFGPLRNPEFFKQVQLEETFGALEWPNGADIDPTVLHDWPDHVEAIVKRQRELFAISRMS